MTRTALAGLLAATCLAGAAEAGLDICNDTGFVQSVAIGYQGDEGWTSEGWWNVQPGDCATVVGGDLERRYYYYRAEVDGGEFAGETYFFCTTPQVFTIVGDSECEARGYDREEFAEIDTGSTATAFTFTLVDPEQAMDAPAVEAPEVEVPQPVLPVLPVLPEIGSVEEPAPDEDEQAGIDAAPEGLDEGEPDEPAMDEPLFDPDFGRRDGNPRVGSSRS